MKIVIGIIFVLTAFVMFFVSLTYAATQDKWVECSNEGQQIGDKVCCKSQWVTGYAATFSQSGVRAKTVWKVDVGGTDYPSGVADNSKVIACPLSGSPSYAYKTAPGKEGTQYVCNTGCSGSVTEADKSKTATYKTQYQLTMQVNPVGGGTTEPKVGTDWRDAGSGLSISATATPPLKFASWTGSIPQGYDGNAYSGIDNPRIIIMSSPITETANFVPPEAPVDHCSQSFTHSPNDAGTANNRHFSCTSPNSCQVVLCPTDASDPDGQDFQNFGTCTDFSGCNSGQCQSSALIDSCTSDTSLRESLVSGSTCSFIEKNCEELGTGWTCSGGKCVPPPITPTPLPAPTPAPCTHFLSLKDLPKVNTKIGNQFTWDITLQERSSNCGASINYKIPSVSIFDSNSCHEQTGIYTATSRPPNGVKLTFPQEFLLENNKDTNQFKVFVKAKAGKSCTLSFDFKVGELKVDPSFSVQSENVPNQPPHVSSFDSSGDKSAFASKWEAFYPDNKPEREMKVKCGLNCDPEVQDCSLVSGKGCLPYDAPQGSEEVKKGSCVVPSPAYDFSTSNDVICLFYDPADPSLKTRTINSFIPFDFQPRISEKLIAQVGQPVEFKIDIANTGLLSDSYSLTITKPDTVDVSPTSITTQTINKGEITTVGITITPLVDTTSEIEVTIQSLASGKTLVLRLELQPGLFSLPEFGLVGFLQIIAIAAIAYFLLVHRNFVPKKRRKRR